MIIRVEQRVRHSSSSVLTFFSVNEKRFTNNETVLKLWAGKDATKPFKKNHNERILRNYTQHVVGTLEGEDTGKGNGKEASKWSFWWKSEKTTTLGKVGDGVIKKIWIAEKRNGDDIKEVVERVEVVDKGKVSKDEELKLDEIEGNGSARSTAEVLGDQVESVGL
jgi:hypothetical protein